MSVVKVLISGRSGSGKTTAINYIKQIARGRECKAVHIKDYPILYEMYKEDLKKDGGRFKHAKYGGFEIVDYTAFDDGLRELEKQVQKRVHYSRSSGASELVLVEFARSDYRNALRNFSADFLQDAYFFYVEADVETCIARIHERITVPPRPDYHYVPDAILRSYFNNPGDWDYMTHECKQDFAMMKEVVTYRNTGSRADLLARVTEFMEPVFAEENIYSEQLEPQPAGA